MQCLRLGLYLLWVNALVKVALKIIRMHACRAAVAAFLGAVAALAPAPTEHLLVLKPRPNMVLP